MAHYAFLNNDATTGTLREELDVLYRDMGALTSEEEKDTAAIEAKQAEIDSKQQEIDNALCVVTRVITGVPETYEVAASDETLEQEIKDLEDSRVDQETGQSLPLEEVIAIEAEIKTKLEELHALPTMIVDNTEYWEGYYGNGQLCKRTSYNTIGGVHQNGGTPFRKNYAGVGYTYDPVRDAFYAPQPYGSWTLNEDTCLWECPVEKPEGEHWWIEESQEWIEPIEQPEGKTFFHTGEKMWITTPLDSIKPYPSWVIEDVDMSPRVFTHTGLSVYSTWVAPVEKPNDGMSYLWDEETLNWILAE